jgi:virulence-associated protein VagC
MKTLTIRSNKINLPADIVKRLNGKEVEIVETQEGVLLRPVENVIKMTRGFLKGKGLFSSEKFMSGKADEKELE